MHATTRAQHYQAMTTWNCVLKHSVRGNVQIVTLIQCLNSRFSNVRYLHVKGLSYPKLSQTPEHAAYVLGLARIHRAF